MKRSKLFLAFMLFIASMSNNLVAANPIEGLKATERNVLDIETPINTSVYSEGMAVITKNGKYGFVNRQKVTIITPKYDDIRLFKNNYAAVKNSTGWFFVNKQGQKITYDTYDSVSDFDANGYAIVSKNKMYGVINEQGQHVVALKYKKIQIAENGEISVFIDGTWKAI